MMIITDNNIYDNKNIFGNAQDDIKDNSKNNNDEKQNFKRQNIFLYL